MFRILYDTDLKDISLKTRYSEPLLLFISVLSCLLSDRKVFVYGNPVTMIQILNRLTQYMIGNERFKSNSSANATFNSSFLP
ncbi:MAG: hypothetical protein ACJAYV_002498 [Oleispira sp.]|jgi:hypothetical protein